MGKSGAKLPVAEPQPFVAGQFFKAHRATRTDFVSANADFSSHAKLGAVSEPRRGVPIHRGGVYFVKKLASGEFVARDDAVRVSRTVMIDVLDGLAYSIDDTDVENVVVILGKKILVGRSLYSIARAVLPRLQDLQRG